MATADNAVINFSHLTLTLLFRCNYRCPSCLVGDMLTRQDAITFEEAVRIIDSAAELDTFQVVAFVGGEPFLVYPLMLKIATYIHSKYKVAMTVSTNSYWANVLEKARAKVEPLASLGLRWMLLSWDDFHAEFGKIQQVANAITACKEFGVKPTIQNIYLKTSTRIDSIKDNLGNLCDTSEVRWVENPCIPVGLGSTIPETEHLFMDIDSLPYGRCTAGTVLNIQANGDVKPCCGAGLMADHLTMGNVRNESVDTLIKRSSVNPIFNSLVAYKGPKQLIRALRDAGRDDLLPTHVTDPCDACFNLMKKDEAFNVLKEQLANHQIAMILNRVASEELSLSKIVIQ